MVPQQYNQFVKSYDYDKSLVVFDEDGGTMNLATGPAILYDAIFPLMLIQGGHVAKDQELDELRDRLVICLYKEPSNKGNIVKDKFYLMPATIINYGFRYYEGAYNGKESNLLCYSNNGLTPSDRIDVPCSEQCGVMETRNGVTQLREVCEKAKWRKNERPVCQKQVTVGFLELEDKLPVSMTLHGTGLGAFNGLLRTYGTMRNVARLKKKSINDYVIELSVIKKGQYSVPDFKMVEAEEIPVRDLIPLRNYYMETLFVNKRVEEPEQETKGGDIVISEATEEDRETVRNASEFDWG